MYAPPAPVHLHRHHDYIYQVEPRVTRVEPSLDSDSDSTTVNRILIVGYANAKLTRRIGCVGGAMRRSTALSRVNRYLSTWEFDFVPHKINWILKINGHHARHLYPALAYRKKSVDYIA